MSRRAVLVAVLAPALLALGAARASAQVATALLATAQVNGVPLVVTSTTNLRFGTVPPGVATTVNPKTSASAGFFAISGGRRAEIRVTFTLPAQLRAGTGPFTMPIAFGATAACGRPTNLQAGCTAFDPAVGLVDRIRNSVAPNNTYYVWLGGTVTPAAAQQGGSYGGTVTMTVAYTGN